jgi:hypothetical protein
MSCSMMLQSHALFLCVGCCCRSRLGCQVVASKELDGLRVRIPAATRNFYVSEQQQQQQQQ